MNLNYSYRSLLITTLLFGILFLAFKSITLSKYEVVKEESFDVEYADEDILLDEELASLSQPDVKKIETNRAFNEAEKFISELENERETVTETSERKEQKDDISDDSKDSSQGTAPINNKTDISEKKEAFSNGSNKTKEISVTNSSKRNSTVSYRLLSRSALDLPNPVYTCNSYGKVVINIEVSETGRVKKATYSKKSSTTKNECLIDNALAYAKKARFTTDAKKTKQLGTITYNFPGQQ